MPLTVHFLNVGHGDCTVIEHPSGRITVIDVNNGDELDLRTREELGSLFGVQGQGLFGLMPPSRRRLAEHGYGVRLTNPLEFLAQRYAGRRIFRYIQTHPDMDHLRGISALVDSNLTPVNFWDTNHAKEPEIQPRDASDWESYLSLRNGHVAGVKVLRLTRGSTGAFWNRDANGVAGGDAIEVLSPSIELQEWANQNEAWNELSYVLRVSHGGRSMILGGDAGDRTWADILAHYGDSLKCQVLKASHHGRDSGYYGPAVKVMSPGLTIVSVGKKPATDASNCYRTYCNDVWSTRWLGNITIQFPDTSAQPYVYSTEYEL